VESSDLAQGPAGSYELGNALSNVTEGRYLKEKLSDLQLSTTDYAPRSHTGWFRTYQNKNSHYIYISLSTTAIPLNSVHQHFNTCLTGDRVPSHCKDQTDNAIYEIICINIQSKLYEIYKYALRQNAFFLALQAAV